MILRPDEFPEGGHDDLLLGPDGYPVMGPSLLRHALRQMMAHDAMHQPYFGGYDFRLGQPINYCYLCGEEWPCATERARALRERFAP